jgi:hypothetical protein
MPVGRIILKEISESKKLSMLKSDGARLLYTWLIPHLNVNGCFSADPVVVKARIFTRLNKSIEEVNEYLDDLENNNLIVRYNSDGDDFLIMPNFADKQPKLNKDREGKVNIPLPTQEQLMSKSRPTPTQIKLSEVKLNKANATPAELQPVDNSAPKPEPKTEIKAEPVPEPPKEKNAFFEKRNKEFAETMAKIKAKYNYKEQQEIENWIKANYRGKHPDALIHTLNSIVHPVRPGKPDISISLYLDKVIALENQNYNAADYDKQAAEFKKPGMFSIGDIFAGMKLHAGVTTRSS